MPSLSPTPSLPRSTRTWMLACGVLAWSLLATACAGAQDRPLPIGAVQGAGATSPLVGRTVTVEGVVTFTGDGSLGGWFLQDRGDGDPATSDALFVLAEGPVTVVPGQRLRVRGMVAEPDAGGGTRTALRSAEVTVLGTAPLPRPLAIARPPQDWASLDGMRVRISAPLTVAGTHRLDRHGELIVNFGERLRTPTDAAPPGEAARALAADNARRSLRLDDGSTAERPATVGYLPAAGGAGPRARGWGGGGGGDLPAAGVPRTGARVSKVEGVLDRRDGAWRLQLTARPAFRHAPPPPAPKVGGDVRIAAFNLENYFNGDGRGGGFPTPRGARTPAELQGQQARLVATIGALAPDIAALMEIENDGFGPDSAIATLVAALNADGGDWRFIATDAGQGGDQIRVGLLYRASRVAPVGAAATFTDDLFGKANRPPLAQAFRSTARGGGGPAFTVVANHFKSKGCGTAAGTDADQKDGQGCWNATRTESARRLDAWMRTDPTGSGSDLAMIVGDFNAYSMEDPIRLLQAAGWRDAFAGQRGVPYSYVYDAQIGRLDHALLSPALAARLAGAAEWHSNADEPDSRGYQAQPAARTPWRSSDHDPLVVGFRLGRP